MSKNYVIVFLAILMAGCSYIYYMFFYGELVNKSFYVALQGFAEQVEYNPPLTLNKDITPLFIKDAMLFKGVSYDMLGIPTKHEKFPYFWVVTNAHDNSSPPDYIFSITAGDQFFLPCDYFEHLNKNVRMDNIVKIFLREHCEINE